MLKALKTILGGGDVIKEGFDLIDSLHDSDTETIRAKTEAKVERLKAYAPFKVAQRYLALLFGFGYMISFTVSLGIGLWKNPSVETVTSIMQAFKLSYIMLMIVTFYFGGGAFEGGADAVKRMREKKKDSTNPQSTDTVSEPESGPAAR